MFVTNSRSKKEGRRKKEEGRRRKKEILKKGKNDINNYLKSTMATIFKHI
ncbi:hypothetical protein [Okeania sp. KiyG1]|nr:hypothetical protein [Okeania sp. KiyG1]